MGQKKATHQLVTFPYPGSKGRLAPTILSFVPPAGRKFIDVFAGRGNITFRAWATELLASYNESVRQSPSRGNKKCNCPKHEPTAYTSTVPFPTKLQKADLLSFQSIHRCFHSI